MARPGVNYETIKQTAIKLLSQGMAPSVQKVREVLGTGSNTTIAEHLKIWREEYAQKTIHHLPANMPKELISAFEVLWQTAMEQAQNQLAEYKCAVEKESAAALQKERDAVKSVADMKQKQEEISIVLQQEIENKQKLNVEFAVANERLLKREEDLSTQKNQYDERLKRLYEEKDGMAIQYQQLHNETKALQERLTIQAQQHQNSLDQQNALHEQSENRWLKLIDQAKQEVKDTHKKYVILSNQSDEKFKKLNAALADLQQNYFEKSAQLNTAQERIIQIKQEVNFLETEYIKARATIIKLEEEQKNVPALVKNKSKKEKCLKSETKSSF